jgi:hypothetical protein
MISASPRSVVGCAFICAFPDLVVDYLIQHEGMQIEMAERAFK